MYFLVLSLSLLIYVYMFACVNVLHAHTGAHEGQKTALAPLELE